MKKKIRKWTIEQKLKILEEVKEEKYPVRKIAAKYNIDPSQIYDWRKNLKHIMISERRGVYEPDLDTSCDYTKENHRAIIDTLLNMLNGFIQREMQNCCVQKAKRQ